MATHLDFDDPKYREAAAAILQRHNADEEEANITSAVRDFLIATGLVDADAIREEQSPALGSRKAVDLVALDTFIEMKRRVGSGSGFSPSQEYVDQLDQYLALSGQQGRVRMGLLTDGKYWLLRWPNAGPIKTAPPHGFVLDKPDRWPQLYEWLRDRALAAMDDKIPDRQTIAERFGPNSPSYQRDIEALTKLYLDNKAMGTIIVKRDLWQNLLTAALGEAASSAHVDALFVRHTYLTAVIGMLVQARFDVDIDALAERDPADLLMGAQFRDRTGLQGIVESDFFSWPVEFDGGPQLLKTVAHSVARFNWNQAPTDIAAILYETVIPQDERKQLGEYYTPEWLARAIVREVITEPLTQEVLDPACGSGSFIAEAVRHFLDAAEGHLTLEERLEWLRFSITGIDIHPVAVHLARAAWVLAAHPAIQAAGQAGLAATVTAPIYLGDSLQTRYHNGDLFAEDNVTVSVEDPENTELVFPRRLVEDADRFDSLMGDIADAIERGRDPSVVLNDHNIADDMDRKTLQTTIEAMQRLHGEGRNHIWAYYTRNLVRPVALANRKVNVIVGNPPWLPFNQTKDTMRTALERQSKTDYGIWSGGRYAPHQDIAGLFFTRCVDLYLKDGGVIGMVMPHSALQSGQYAKWRSGAWRNVQGTHRLGVDFGHKTSWDLERLQPNDFFPIASSTVFARRVGEVDPVTPLSGSAEQWVGPTGTSEVQRLAAVITNTAVRGTSPYNSFSRQGASIVPRCLFFVQEKESDNLFQAPGTVLVDARRGSWDKEPWRSLRLVELDDQAIEAQHVFDVHLGETIVPYAALTPLRAALPLKHGDTSLPFASPGVSGIDIEPLGRRMRERWQGVTGIWGKNKERHNKLTLSGRLDYNGELSGQLAWRKNPGDRVVRVVYTSSGRPTAAILDRGGLVVDYTLYWVQLSEMQEARYLLAIINSDVLEEAVNIYTVPNWSGRTRHLQKHLWKLPIPEFDPGDALHLDIAQAGAVAEAGAARKLAEVRASRGDDVSGTIIRRELRAWLRSSDEGKAVEDAVGRLLGG